MKKAIQIDERDNVATVTSEVPSGELIEVLSAKGGVILVSKALEVIRFGHKISLADLKRGDPVIKYGERIGLASKSIKIGRWVHTHNVESAVVPTSEFKVEDQ
jgi:altronate dehydratase